MSSCRCFKVGGPFIAEDPDCPRHGLEAQIEASEREARESSLEAKNASTQEQLDELRQMIVDLQNKVESQEQWIGSLSREMHNR